MVPFASGFHLPEGTGYRIYVVVAFPRNFVTNRANLVDD
jgi:hypothetical protein